MISSKQHTARFLLRHYRRQDTVDLMRRRNNYRAAIRRPDLHNPAFVAIARFRLPLVEYTLRTMVDALRNSPRAR